MSASITFRVALVGGLLLGGVASLSAVEVHTLRSGNGIPGGPDAQITYLQGPPESEFNVPLTPAQFAAADAGPPTYILTGIHPAWTPLLAADPLAQWISDDVSEYSGSTNLYAVDFTVVAGSVSSATLDFHFMADNWLGEVWIPINEGLYVNGTPIAGTSGGNHAAQTSWTGLNISALVNPGPNTLYILSSDVGGPGGLIFSARIAINDDGTVDAPEEALSFRLGEAWPNPFNPSTTISFTMPETGMASLAVYNLTGARVATLWNGLAARGTHDVVFDAAALPSGLYLYQLSTAEGMRTRKMVLRK